MSDLTRQQLCAELSVSESTLKKLEKAGMPFKSSSWTNRHTYDLVKCSMWIRANKPGSRAQADDPIRLPRNFYSGNARAKQLNRAPCWADKEAIKAVYVEARRLTWASGVEHHVDHEIPLQGEFVSGLHVHNNLQILTGSENSKKRNRFEVEV